MFFKSVFHMRQLGNKLARRLKYSTIIISVCTFQNEVTLARRQLSKQHIFDFCGFCMKQFIEKFFSGKGQGQYYFTRALVGCIGVYAYDWDSHKGDCKEISSYMKEIAILDSLKDQTICPICDKTKITSKTSEELDSCTCDKTALLGWELYLQQDGLVIWRKQQDKSAFYVYKVYGKYDDITANDFLHVQIDINYRKQWDDTAASLEIIESDPLNPVTNHVIYWEIKWPKLFANRDYVYFRKLLIDRSKNLVVICSKSTTHPKYPVHPNKQRVEDYWSYMVIKPFKSFEEPGLQFVLTYFDNPGLALPSSVISWVAQKQMPEFLNKMYIATKLYAERKQQLSKKPILWNSSRNTEKRLQIGGGINLNSEKHS